EELVAIELSRPRFEASGAIIAHVLYLDGFGNVGLDVTHDDLDGTGLKIGRRVVVHAASGLSEAALFLRTFAEAGRGELLIYEDAYRRLALAVSHGSAARHLGIAAGDELRIVP